MLLAILAYIGVSVLLLAGAVLFFARALKTLLSTKPTQSTMPTVPLSEQLGDAQKRAEIIAMLERQFHSSPSIDP